MAADKNTVIYPSDDPRCTKFEQEFLNAFETATGLIYFTEYSLKRVVALDELLKNIKRHPVELLITEIGDAQGFTPFWDQLESEQRWPLSRSDKHGSVLLTQSETREDSEVRNNDMDETPDVAKSVILATILHTLLGTRDFAVWLKAKMNTGKQSEKGHLLSRAFEWGLADTVELLLVSGADPQDHVIGTLNLSHGAHGQYEESRFLIAAHLFLKLTPVSHYWSFKEDRYREDPMVRASLLRKDVGPFGPNDIQKSSLTWIHVRRNNILLMMATVRIYSWNAAQNLGEIFEALRRGSDDSHLTYLEPTYQRRSLQIPIEFPYLVLTTIGQQKIKRHKHEKLNKDLKRHGDILSFDHLERTLDEAYYPGLSREALKIRNHDQVVSHSKDDFESFDKRESSSERPDEGAFILMVPQLWLYKLGNVVISAYSMPQGTPYAFNMERGEVRYYDRMRMKKENWENQATPADIHLGLIITSFIDRFGKSYRDLDDGVNYPPPLDLFEARMVQLLEEVREYIGRPSGGKSNSSGLEYRRERYYIHVVSDVRSELAMIQHVLEQQERILKQFLEECVPASEKQHLPDWAPIKNSQETIQLYMRRIKKIDGDADRIEKSIQDMLNLKRTHASIRDAHSSLIVSTAVIGFTVITIVFTPLAFLTALFALKIDGFENLQISGSDGVFHSGKIGGIFVSTEILTLVLTGIAVWLAFKYINRDQENSDRQTLLHTWQLQDEDEAMSTRSASSASWLEPHQAELTELDHQSPRQDEAKPIRSASAATWPIGPKAQLKYFHSKERTKIPDLESLRQFKLQGATASSSENSNPAIAPHT